MFEMPQGPGCYLVCEFDFERNDLSFVTWPCLQACADGLRTLLTCTVYIPPILSGPSDCF